MANDKNAVGGEIISMCTKCKQSLAHTIAVRVGDRIAKVLCRTCGTLHRYINPHALLTAPRKRSKKVTPEEVWGKMVDLVSTQKKIPYTFSGNFKENDLIDHTTFGLGVVTNLLSGDKIQVIFKEGEKILVARR
ncbi:MAG: hypothetical protein ACREIQ_03820 [Nitrospiria bacterium]